jgi:hypothetical protein
MATRLTRKTVAQSRVNLEVERQELVRRHPHGARTAQLPGRIFFTSSSDGSTLSPGTYS